MPVLARWVKDYQTQGLRVILNHRGKATPVAIRRICQQYSVTSTVVNFASVAGDNAAKLGHLYLFDHTGKCVWEGGHGEASSVLRSVMQKAPFPLLAGLEINKFKKLDAALKKGLPCGKALKLVETKAKSKDADEAKEASAIKKRLVDHAVKLAKRARLAKADDPYFCFDQYQRLAKEYSGTQLGKNVETKRIKPLTKDKEFMKLYEAGRLAHQIRTYGAALKPIGDNPIDLKNKTCYKLNRTAASRMLKTLKIMKSSHSETEYYKDIVQYVTEFGVSV